MAREKDPASRRSTHTKIIFKQLTLNFNDNRNCINDIYDFSTIIVGKLVFVFVFRGHWVGEGSDASRER